MTKKLFVVCGPTASGKTVYAIQLALEHQAEIISADSRQFYREMVIGTAMPTHEELNTVPHHFAGHLSIADSYSVGHYARDVNAFLDDYFRSRDTAVMVGGSGLYIKAALEGLDEFPDVPSAVREMLNTQHAELGLSYLQEELQRLDPVYYAQVDIHNPARLKRALEICRVSGQPYSSFRKGAKKELPFEVHKIGLTMDKPLLHERIRLRLKQMFASGLEEEVRSLWPYRHTTALQTVGYREFDGYFDGLKPLQQVKDEIYMNTIHYAKRQMTWFRKDEDVMWGLGIGD